MGSANASMSPQKAPASPPRLIDVIGPPTPAQARRLIALLGLAGALPQRAPDAPTTPVPQTHAA